MKKLFTLVAAAAFALTANALDFSFTADPAAGSTVTELSTISVTFPNLVEPEFANKSAITLTRDGEKVDAKLDIPYPTNVLKVVCNETQTAAGTYTLTIPALSITGYDEEYNAEDNPSDITMSWIIEGASGGLDFSFTADPAAGSTVTELSTISVTFPNLVEPEFANKSAITLTRDGEKVDAKLDIPYPTNVLKVVCNETQTAAGTYTLTIPALSITGYDEEYNAEDNPSDITISWIIEAAGGTLDFSHTVTPENNETVESLDQVVLEFPEVRRVECGEIEVKHNDEVLATTAYSAMTEANVLVINFTETITAGTVAINIPAGAVTGHKGDVSETNPEAITLAYTVAKAVVYDLTATFASPKPNADGEISADRQIDSWIFVCDAKDIVADPNATEPNVTIKEDNGEWVKTGTLKKGFGVNQNMSYFSVAIGAPVYNGAYTVTITKGAFGDATWAANHEYGHSNDDVVLHFTFVDGKEYLEYTLEPTVTPAAGEYTNGADFATVTVKFAEEVEAVEDAAATLGMENSFQNETVALVKGEDGSYTATFKAPTETGKYILTIEEGMFGNAEYISSNMTKGVASKAVTVEYILKQDTSGIKGIEAETAANGVYSMLGVRVADDLKNLPAGLYIVNGRKVLKK